MPSASCTGSRFSFLLKSQLQFAGSHLLTSLLAFNVGIELGQLLVLAILVPLIALLFSWVRSGEKALNLILSLLIGHTAWHWTVERAQALAMSNGRRWQSGWGPRAWRWRRSGSWAG